MARRATPKETLSKTIAAAAAAPASAVANAAADAGATIETLLGSSVLPALIAIGDAEVQLGEIVAAAHTKSGLSVEDWNALEDAARELLLEAEIKRRLAALEKAPEPEPQPEPAPQPVSLAELLDGFRSALTARTFSGSPVELHRLESHPVAPLFYLLSWGLDQLPASDRATRLVTDLSKLRDRAEDLINGVEDRTVVATEAFKANLSEGLEDWTDALKARLNEQLDQAAAERGMSREAIVSFANGFLSGVEANRALSNPGHPDFQPTEAVPQPVFEALPAEIPEGKIRIKVSGPQAGRRRLGRQFVPEPVTIDVTADELDVLRADSALKVKPVEPE